MLTVSSRAVATHQTPPTWVLAQNGGAFELKIEEKVSFQLVPSVIKWMA